MNPSDVRMMWMSSQYPERISLEDAATFFGHPSVGLSVIDDINQQPTMELNPMMSIVGGDFSGQAAAAAALGIQPAATLITTNANDLYFGQMGLQQQLLHSAAVYQNYTGVVDDDNAAATAGDVDHNSIPSGGILIGNNDITNSIGGTQFISADDSMSQHQSHSQYYNQIIDDDDDNAGGPIYEDDDDIIEIPPKQEIINIDDFVMMTDSNSYDGTDFMDQATVDAIEKEESSEEKDDMLLPIPMQAASSLMSTKLARASTSVAAVSSSARTQRKTRKIEPVNRPGLVLKTPIAYKGNIDPSVIPISKDGMAVCERCGAIGVKHTFYTKSRRFCSMSCARGELYQLVVNKQMSGSSSQAQQQTSDMSNEQVDDGGRMSMQAQSDMELALRVAHIKNSNYRFRITDQSKITQINGYGEPITNMSEAETGGSCESSNDDDMPSSSSAHSFERNLQDQQKLPGSTAPKALRMYHDVLPQDELPQIPKYETLPTPCPQMDKIISVRRRHIDASQTFDWAPRLMMNDFVAAPITCFPHTPGHDVWDNLGLGMKIEVENTDCDNMEVIQPGQTPHSFWVATIHNIQGYKALMRYEGFDDASHDFWVNLCNAEVHAVGWCATRGKPLIPPRTIKHKYKDWKDFLVARLSGARTLPSSFYNKINESMQSRFRIGLNLECVDKNRISQVRLATVTKIVGKRLHLKYFDVDEAFWCHEDSPIIHPVGWATTVGHNLAAPQDYLERMLAGRDAMIEVLPDDATIEIFKMNFTFDEYYVEGKANSFVEGMKLEAVDPLNLSSICVATVMAVLKFGYMMIRIDFYTPDETGADWFCYHEKSACIFPVGFCASNNITLVPPYGYDINTFSWESYMAETGCIAAGQHLFHRVIPDHGFEVGMSLECADLMDPKLICVATVVRVVGRLLKIHFDGWIDDYDQWLDCESPDIYPVGWCALVNYKLEGPPPQETQQALKQTHKAKPAQKKRKTKMNKNAATKAAEPAVKTRTIPLKTTPHLPKLSIKLDLKPEHQNPAFYEDHTNDNDDDDDEDDDDYNDDSNSNQSRTGSSSTMVERVEATPPALLVEPHSSTSKQQNSPVSSSKYIPRLNGDHIPDSDQPLAPETWNIYDVSQFLRVNDCTAHCDTFSRNKVDGKRLLQLTKDEIVSILGMKVGPTLKLYALITQLKCKLNPNKARMHKANKAFL